MASSKTRDHHLKKGLHYLAQGLAANPGVELLEALCRHAEARTGPLTPNTIRVYKQDYLAALERLADRSTAGDVLAERCRARIEMTLESRKGLPAEKRTSSRKVKDPPEWMVLAVFEHLKRMALRYRRIRSVAVGLYCLLIPKVGIRTVELVGARLEGDWLVVQNSKRRFGEEPERRIGIGKFHPTHQAALRVLVDIVDVDVGELGYERWLDNLAQILATACKAASRPGREIPRLAPSAFRHTALSTWHAAGYSAEEIARLAGHLSLDTAKRHYIRKSSAHPVRNDLAEPEGRIPAAAVDVGKAPEEPEIILGDFPMPPRAPQPSQEGAKIWAEYKAKLEMEVSPNRSSHRDVRSVPHANEAARKRP